VLLIDDDEALAPLLAEFLGQFGLSMRAAATPEEGLRLLKSRPPDIVILDVMLPGRDGFSVCRELRSRGNKTPILMLTARDTVDDRVTGLDTGADDYLVKPFAFKELVARVRAITRRQGDTRSVDLQVGDLILNTLTHTAQRGEHRIELTTKEYNLLEFLMRNPGRVLSRTQIAEHVWNLDFLSESNLVDVYIRYLRRKIDDGSEQKLIKTVRGSGYLISDEPE